MENISENIIYQKNKCDNEEKTMENEGCLINNFHFSFENKIDLNELNFLSNIILETENERIEENNDFDEDNKEENIVFTAILDDLNKNIEINIKELEHENKNYKECQEILEILKCPLSDKNIRNGISPFKPLLKPKKISLIGKVLCDTHINDNNNNSHNNSTKNSTHNDNNNGKVFCGKL